MHQQLAYGDGALPNRGDLIIFRIPGLNLRHGMGQLFPHEGQGTLTSIQDPEGLVEVRPYSWHFELRQILDPKTRKVLHDKGWFNSRGQKVEKAPDQFSYAPEIVSEKPGKFEGDDVIIKTTVKPVSMIPVLPHILALVERRSTTRLN